METEVLYQVQDGVATLTMNRPQSLNSMNPGLIDGLHDALTKAAADDQVRCLVLTGAGRAFCAGGDLGYLNGIDSLAEKRAFINRVGDVARRITMLPKPVIAKVNGVTAGAGVNLMLACDLVYAVATAKFGESFAKVGLIPDCGGLFFLPRTVGTLKAKELMFTADLITAAEAEKLGLVNHLCPAEQLDATVAAMAKRLAESAPLSISLIKQYVNQPGLTLDDVLAAEAVAQPLCMGSRDCAEGIAAFKEKRAPKFTGK
ncbi:MAG: enoyl-CoA hydratase [Acidaminococcaceae bacterium]|jgi:2-(1,2-epoxy-1,2-dihydrophenyl)acetyl-CoA isomerase|nr:enoyl-CoA hydratase [Acidaminococcaceae bacterium]